MPARLNKNDVTEVLRFRTPGKLKALFVAHCNDMGLSISDRIRQLIEADCCEQLEFSEKENHHENDY